MKKIIIVFVAVISSCLLTAQTKKTVKPAVKKTASSGQASTNVVAENSAIGKEILAAGLPKSVIPTVQILSKKCCAYFVANPSKLQKAKTIQNFSSAFEDAMVSNPTDIKKLASLQPKNIAVEEYFGSIMKIVVSDLFTGSCPSFLTAINNNPELMAALSKEGQSAEVAEKQSGATTDGQNQVLEEMKTIGLPESDLPTIEKLAVDACDDIERRIKKSGTPKTKEDFENMLGESIQKVGEKEFLDLAAKVKDDEQSAAYKIGRLIGLRMGNMGCKTLLEVVIAHPEFTK